MSYGVKLKRTPFKRKPVTKKACKPTGLTEQLDIVFSKYIRLRDAGPNGYTVCISCGNTFPFEQMQCGHYYPRWHGSTRWDEDNCHSQCVFCNCYEHGNLEGYKPNLIAKIGQEKFDDLGERAKETKQWSDDEIKEMIKRYKSLIKKFND